MAGRGLAWGVVGTGQVSEQVAADLALVAGSRRLAVASRSTERAHAFAGRFGFGRAHGSVAALLADDEVDVVYVATPHATHATIAVAALEAGKHVLVEKPLGADAYEARRIADAAGASGRFAMEAMWMRFNPAYRSLLDDVRSGLIGRPIHVRASFGLPFAEVSSPRWSADLRSSTLLDQGIYGVTLAWDLFGRPLAVTGIAQVRPDGVDVTDYLTLEYDGGRVAHVAASAVSYLEPSASVSGTGGWLNADAPFWATTRYRRHVGDIPESLFAPRTVSFGREGIGYVPMLRAVGEAITTGLSQHPWHTLADSVAVLEILDQARVALSTVPHPDSSPQPIGLP